MARKSNSRRKYNRVLGWELELVGKVARAFRSTDPEELEAELARKLCELKSQELPVIRYWRGYVAKFLYNKAANYVRDQRARDAKLASLQNPSPDVDVAPELENRLSSPEPAPDANVAFTQLWASLNPNLRRVWELLLEEKGNQAKVARRIGKHRNTVRHWIHTILRVIKQHDF